MMMIAPSSFLLVVVYSFVDFPYLSICIPSQKAKLYFFKLLKIARNMKIYRFPLFFTFSKACYACVAGLARVAIPSSKKAILVWYLALAGCQFKNVVSSTLFFSTDEFRIRFGWFWEEKNDIKSNFKVKRKLNILFSFNLKISRFFSLLKVVDHLVEEVDHHIGD